MADGLVAADDLYHGEPTIENIRSFVNGRAEAREAFLEGFEMLDPPESARDLHEVALGVMTRLAGAEAQLASAVEQTDSFESWDAVWQTPEARAMFDVELEAVALCESAQGDFDASSRNAELGDTPWIPPEMKEVVVVAFRCRG